MQRAAKIRRTVRSTALATVLAAFLASHAGCVLLGGYPRPGPEICDNLRDDDLDGSVDCDDDACDTDPRPVWDADGDRFLGLAAAPDGALRIFESRDDCGTWTQVADVPPGALPAPTPQPLFDPMTGTFDYGAG